MNNNSTSTTKTWLEKAVELSQPIQIAHHERVLSEVLIDQARMNALKSQYSIGIYLAAAFDLMIAAEYYRAIAHRGWQYCPANVPLLYYPYTNTCPHCALTGNFHYHPANKPASGVIGQTTSRLLCVFLQMIFDKNRNVPLIVKRGIEPIDLLIIDQDDSKVLAAEVKASPLTTLPLAVNTEVLTEILDNGEVSKLNHISIDYTSLSSSEFFLLLPVKLESGLWSSSLHSIGKKTPEKYWSYYAITALLTENPSFYKQYFDYWIDAFRCYQQLDKTTTIFWLTNGCGQPSPRPLDWPNRKSGGGYESISDGKTSVGMDRTDDIKKGIYQILKLGVQGKSECCDLELKIALISNIHAVRHYDEYLSVLENVVWTQDLTHKASYAYDLDPNAKLFNLFDGILTFTSNFIKDDWLKRIFNFNK